MASIKVGDCDIQPLKHVRNLGTWFDNHVSMNTHIGKACSKTFRGLYNIRQIRKYLSPESTKLFNSCVCYITFRLLQRSFV